MPTFSQTWTSPGTVDICIPFGTTQVSVTTWGAGGCGGGRTTAGYGGGGGGGGCAVSSYNVAPGDRLEIVVGAGGTSAGTNDGGSSYINHYQLTSSGWGAPTQIAIGNGGRGVNANNSNGASGGSGSGDSVYNGGSGANGNALYGGGGGGGGAGDANNGSGRSGSTGGNDGVS